MKLSHIDENSWEISELNQIIWNFLQFKKIWTHLFILHFMQVQHADYISDKESDHDIVDINMSIQNMSKSEATLK